jgi:rhodanese-related sulfurtransferase
VPTTIGRDEVRRLIIDGAQLVEVLPRAEYDDEHLPEAMHLPLKSLSASSADATLDRAKPVIVYCWDALCDMSPRAAWRLERFGFAPVYDYAVGKVDWMAAGLPTVRSRGGGDRAIDAADTRPRTCLSDLPVSALTWPERPVVVVNDVGIVLGRIDTVPKTIDPSQVAEEVMLPGPATVRAHEPLADLLSRMERRDVPHMIVTTPEGRLLGVVHLNPNP